jgi:hypothetical protein
MSLALFPSVHKMKSLIISREESIILLSCFLWCSLDVQLCCSSLRYHRLALVGVPAIHPVCRIINPCKCSILVIQEAKEPPRFWLTAQVGLVESSVKWNVGRISITLVRLVVQSWCILRISTTLVNKPVSHQLTFFLSWLAYTRSVSWLANWNRLINGW